ncbi:MAG: UvrD-helicase domain-containing protein [Myxococcaceae bacterium]
MSALALEELLARNGCLFAGAGAGKTHGLLSVALGLLAGAGGREPLAPGRLCLLTFTEKAAAEMRERLRGRVEALAEAVATEPELEAAFAALGRPPPPASFWRTVQGQLELATLSTFHAHCARLLRQAPASASIPQGFELLGEEDALQLLVDTAEQTLLDALDAGDAEVDALCAQAELRGTGRGRGLLDVLVAAVVRLREEGQGAAGVAVGDRALATEALLAAVARAEGLLRQALPRAAASEELAATLAACLDVLHGLDAEAPPERLARLDALAGAIPRVGNNGLRGLLASVRESLLDGTLEAPGVASASAGCAAVRHERTLRRVCERVEADYRRALRRGGWMDFAELLVAARDVLRDEVGFRASAQGRTGALLVDEVQDTNTLQLELVVLLAEAREGGPRPVAKHREAVLGLPLEPGFLFAVGDNKQSIYDFRGADVSTFETLAEKVEAEGGARHFLRDNRRSQPALLRVLNAAAAAALPEVAAPRDYEVVFRPEQDGLLPVRPQLGPTVCVDALPVVAAARGSGREAEADVLARWLAFLLSAEAPKTVVEAGQLRRARGGDVAILLRGFSGLEAYRSALRNHHVPHCVLRELNPYTASSAVDASALLGLLSDTSDALSLGAVLRSPFVGLSDGALFRLAASGRLEASVLEGPLPEGFPQDEGARLLRLASLVRRVQALLVPLPLAELLELFWEETGYRTAVAAGPEAEEALAALVPVLALARRWDAAGRGDVAALARRLRVLAAQTAVGGARGAEQARSGHAVQLLSIHAAKGLQWPVVCLADLSTTGVRSPGERLLLDRRLGLAFKPQGPFDAEPRRTPRWAQLQAELKRRDRAEAGRLLYVALTRAQDRLVLSGGGPAPEAWRNRLEPALLAADAAASVRHLALADIPLPRPLAAASAEEEGALEAALVQLGRLRTALQPTFEGVQLPASALEDFRRCPRRAWLLQQAGLCPEAGDAASLSWAGALPERHRAARPSLLAALAGALGTEAWAAGVPDSALAPHLAVRGLSLGEARALGLLAPLRALAATRALRAAVAAGVRTSPVELVLALSEAQLLATAPVAWEDAGVRYLVSLVPGAPPQLGLEAFAVTLSVLWHAPQPSAQRRVGLSFVDGPDAEPLWLDAAPLSVSALAQQARALLHAGALLPSAQPRMRCEALGCGFAARCHPAPRGL